MDRGLAANQRKSASKAPPVAQERAPALARCAGMRRNQMQTKILFLLSATALALAGCGQKTDTNTADANASADANLAIENTAVAAAPMSAQGFANTLAASDRFEIESSKLAATASESSSIKSFASQMVTAHTASTAKVKTAAAGLTPAVTPDDTLAANQQRILDELKTKTGPDFDGAYAAAQVNAHQAALDALNAYAAGGDTPALKELAKGMIPTVTAHFNMAKGLK
jgi:putative membrane protein